MGDYAASEATQLPDGVNESSQKTHKAENTPFQSQLEYLSQAQPHAGHNAGQYGQHSFDMAAMVGALPATGSIDRRPSYNSNDAGQVNMMPAPNAYQAQQQLAFQPQRNHAFPAHQQPYFPPQWGQGQSPAPNMQRVQPFQMQTQMGFDPSAFGYGMSPAQYSPIDPRFATSPQFAIGAGFPQDMPAQFTRRGSTDPGPIPTYPRGPPRKPKQSGHALWVGNLPPAASIADLKDHFSRDATNDIESVFLIAKSNCAFVNYRTEAACTGAMNRFHDSRFHGVRLVCRLRRGTTPSASTALPEEQVDGELPAPATQSLSPEESQSTDEPPSPIIARSQPAQEAQDEETISEQDSNARLSEKYFIVKSLTAQDLESSVRNNIWATQSHNEDVLNKAYDQADNVYLIFSANKSGEYFGYARMASRITGEPISLASIPFNDEHTGPDAAGSPQSIITPATATAPKGRIIDDSARGTIFWEADRDTSAKEDVKEGSPGLGQGWGRQFKIEWMSTSRLPFYRTRGLRNSWNANREVKIARDGTELEPSVGRRLVQMFHRPSPGPSSGPAVPAGMAYRQ